MTDIIKNIANVGEWESEYDKTLEVLTNYGEVGIVDVPIKVLETIDAYQLSPLIWYSLYRL